MVGRARLVMAPLGNHEERESLTGSPEGADGVESGGVKRKSAPPETGSKFKVVGTMVLAMQRFQGPRPLPTFVSPSWPLPRCDSVTLTTPNPLKLTPATLPYG